MSYEFLQQYWWFLVSLLGALLVFLMFVQGGNSLLFQIGKTAEERRMLVNSTGRKWEFTFTTLVTFGGAFFASFPLFYSTSFGGAYWLWMTILFSFVLQAVSYEFQNKLGNLLGTKTFQSFLVINGILGPLLLGGAVATFFDGSNFLVQKENIANEFQPIISQWANRSHGLDALLDIWNVVFGLAVVFLSRILGALYYINNVNDEIIRQRSRKQVLFNTSLFLVFFLAFMFHLLLKDGYAYNPESGEIFMEPNKYFHNLFGSFPLLALFLIGVIFVLNGVSFTFVVKKKDGSPNTQGIWHTGIGTVMAVLALLLCAGYFNTAYYPSNVDLQSSLTIQNSCSSEFTLRTMFYVSFLIPFVLAYIVYAWRAMDKKKIDREEIAHDEEAY
ncbi:MAG: cytochrome d ubiquinol oxidase subunit II [Bacteroidaceae bacterium]|nr:cytochrome d ubiquinol oxidase subunit II [Bacteroidaceae bacterium]